MRILGKVLVRDCEKMARRSVFLGNDDAVAVLKGMPELSEVNSLGLDLGCDTLGGPDAGRGVLQILNHSYQYLN